MAEVRAAVNWILGKAGLQVVRLGTVESLLEYAQIGRDIETVIGLVQELPLERRAQFIQTLRFSKSQLKQDLFALAQLNFKRDGYFVDLGAADGISGSNTYLMERRFGWRGILVEPARCWHNQLRRNRTAAIETSCAWGESGSVVSFNEVNVPELSTIDSYSSGDSHSEARKLGKLYSVSTISLNDLLAKYDAPSQIDYLSIDTEGSEYEILSAFNFERYKFKVITCEHNFTPAREKVHELLSNRGYIRRFAEISQFEDWFTRAEGDPG